MTEMAMAVRGRLRERTAEEIRVLLARRRISAAELARRTGMKQSTLARRMTGETAFDLDDLEAIAQVLEVPVADLLPRDVNRQVGGESATAWFVKLTEGPTAPRQRPPDNRPPRPPVQRRPDVHTTGPRRTARVPRAGRA